MTRILSLVGFGGARSPQPQPLIGRLQNGPGSQPWGRYFWHWPNQAGPPGRSRAELAYLFQAKPTKRGDRRLIDVDRIEIAHRSVFGSRMAWLQANRSTARGADGCFIAARGCLPACTATTVPASITLDHSTFEFDHQAPLFMFGG
jgi:hypothetical protein